ncbi:unnamed protein product [Cunninghamella blakesleeana]
MIDEVVEGWLSKNSLLSLTSKYHKRYCILTKNELRCYKNKDDQRPSSIIELRHYKIAEKQNSKQQPHSFRIITHCKSYRTYTFIAEHERDCQYWIDRINLNLKTFKGQCHHHCEETNPLSPTILNSNNDDSYSVLDKWLNKLDLNDRQNNVWASATTTSSSSSSTLSPSPTLNSLSQQQHHHHHHHTTSLSSSLSPKLKPFRSSTESLDSLPSETTLSSSAGSRAHSYSQHQSHNNNSSNNNSNHSSINHHHRHPSPTTGYFNIINKTNSNRTSPPSSSSSTLISKSLSSIKKQQQSIRCNNNKIKSDHNINIIEKSTINNNNNSNNNDLDKLLINQHEEWISDDLFDFEDDSVLVEDKIINNTIIPSCLPAPNTPLPDIPNFYMNK